MADTSPTRNAVSDAIQSDNFGWIEDVRRNLAGTDDTLESLIGRVTNCDVDVKADGSIWCNGSWLSQERSDEIVALIEIGV